MKEHWRERRAVQKRQANRMKSQAQKKFKADPIKFGQELFEKKTVGEPEFTAEIALNYFSELYADSKRGEPVLPMPEMQVPEAPSWFLDEKCPSVTEISQVLRRKRNGSAPGMDALSYLPYKCCPSLLPVLTQLFEKIWTTREIPPCWAAASIQLLAKSSKTTESEVQKGSNRKLQGA